MVKNIKELEQLIQQAENNEISWNTEVRLESNISIIKPIQEASLENWSKIRHMAPAWESGELSLITQISQSGKLFNSEWKFTNKETLEEFRRYVNTEAYPFLETRNRGKVRISEVNENDVITTNWKSIAEIFRKSERIFGRNNDNCAFQNKDALCFLQSIINDEFLQNIEYQAGNEFKLGDLEVKKRNAKGEKVEELIETQLPLKDIPSEYWDRVEVSNDWDREYVEAENDKILGWEGSREVPMTFSHGVDGVKRPSMNPSELAPWHRKFKSQEILDNFRKYVDVNKEIKHYFDSYYGEGSESPSFTIRDLAIDIWFTTHLPSQLTQFLKDSNKLFIKNGYGKVTSQEAFEFLQSIVESREIKATVELTQNEYKKLLGGKPEEITIDDQKETERPPEQDRMFKQSEVMIVPSIQPHFLSEDKLKENEIIGKINYKEIGHQNNYVISRNKKGPLQLPLRLFNVRKYNGDNEEGREDKVIKIKDLKKYVEEVKGRTDIKNYATLSYVWGKVENEDELTLLGRKSLTKAIEACNLISIDYLWIDQLCINQKDREEKAEEVTKMRRCYGDSTITLISINTNLNEDKNNLTAILKTILKSEWFSRSWTFQEGWLSKQTIFMFDDCLIDGRALATTWVLHQPQYAEVKFDKSEEGTKKIATPVGWVYYRDGYDSESTVTLTLSQALREIENRRRGIPVDGIYSILGLLPYGEEVKVEYKEKIQDGSHPIYFKEDVEKALLEVMKKAVKAGYGEPLAWFGPSYESPKRCWLPTIIFDEQAKEREKRQKNGSFRVEGGMVIRYKGNKDTSEIFDKNDNIKVNCSEYIIDALVSNVSTWEEGFMIRTGASDICITIKTENDGKYEPSMIKIQGTEESLRKLDRYHCLLVPSKEEWKSDKPFAILAERKKGRIFHRIGLVEIVEGVEKLKNEEQSEVTLGGWAEDDAQLTKNFSSNYESHIEIVSKTNN